MIEALRNTLSDDNKHVRSASLQTLEILANLGLIGQLQLSHLLTDT